MKFPSVAARCSGAANGGSGPISNEDRAEATATAFTNARAWALVAACATSFGLAACGDDGAKATPDAAVNPVDAPGQPVDAATDAPVDPTDPCAACAPLATCDAAAPACACPAGYTGDGTLGGSGCEDIDECAADTDTCDFATCTNTPGAYTCTGLYGASPFQNMLVRIDPVTGTAVDIYRFTLAGETVRGVNGIAKDPTTGTAYAVVKPATGGRLLCTVALETGALTLVGDLEDRFAAIAFRADGQLFGLTGDGADVPHTLYTIDKATAAKTVAATLGNGGDGEMFAYNPVDEHFYHWSGNGTVVFEKFPATAPHTITNIPVTGTPGEMFGAVWRATGTAGGEFVGSNISSQLVTVTTDGVHTVVADSELPDDLRGLVEHTALPHRIQPATGSTAGGETVRIRGQGFQSFAITDVSWGGTTTPMTVIDDTTLELVTPPGTAGPVAVVLEHPSAAQLRWTFTYVEPPPAP